MRGGATDKMYQSLADWLNRLPGGLLHTNIGASALFSAVSGSSVATAATISTVALPAFKNRQYDQRMVLGTIAAGASLGNLIPPGMAFIIYGAMTNTSAGRLVRGRRHPGRDHDGAVPARPSWRSRSGGLGLIGARRSRRRRCASKLGRSVHLLAPLAVFAVVMGGIYTGWATVTESAALGVIVCLPIAAAYGKLNDRDAARVLPLDDAAHRDDLADPRRRRST